MPNDHRPPGHAIGWGSVLLAAAITASPIGAARAQQDLPAPGEWRARVGTGASLKPTYPGADALEIAPLPLVDVTYRAGLPGLDTVFLNTRDGLGVVVLREGPLSFGGSVGYAAGRDQDDDDRLRGLGDIEAAPRGVLFLRADFGVAGASVEAERAFGGQQGTAVSMDVFVRDRLTPSFALVGRIGATWADDEHMTDWFGVSTAQAARSGYQPHTAEAGFRDVTFSLTGNLTLSPQWAVSVTAGATRLLGDAADSPIVERETAPFGLLGVTYRF